jgi:hypothetical protein
MDPYQVLGVDRSWSMPDIEASYRERVRDAHPDRHVHEGPDAVAIADERTRILNEAMAQIRERHGPFAVPGRGGRAGPSTPGANQGGWMGSGTNPADTWAIGDDGGDFGIRFGWSLPDEDRQRTRAAAPQPCPMCGEAFSSLSDFTAHMHMVHQRDPATFTGRRRGRRRQRQSRDPKLIPFLEWLGFVLCAVAVIGVLVWRTTLPAVEANTLTPVLVAVVIASLVLAGRLLYSRFFAEKRGPRRVKF